MRKLVRILILLLAASCTSQEAVPTDVLPDIWPDYVGVTIPRSIAPLNFEVRGADAVQAVLSNGSREVRVRGSFVGIPLRKWRSLTAAGDSLTVQVKARIDGQWRAYLPLSIHLSDDPVDLSLVYRRVDPGYETYARMGIYQRDLASFREKALFENTRIDPGCVNCHSFAHCDPASMQLHFRGGKGGTLIHSEAYGSDIYNMSNPLTLGAVYPYWHPSGRYIAYSVNDIRQSFHNLPSKVLEVYDLESDVVLYDVETRTILVEPLLQDSTAFETFPAFSADGKTLYFCRAAASDDFTRIRYHLYSIGFDPGTGRFDDSLRLVWDRPDKSVSFPRASYDGKSLLFTVSDYGNFSIWHPEADLYTLDLASGDIAPAEALNSEDTESYHAWSSNSRWVVFSSRREDGRYTRLYIAHCKEDGRFDKPFLLPQRRPQQNTLLLQSYNIPEFCDGPVRLNKKRIYSDKRTPIKAQKLR